MSQSPAIASPAPPGSQGETAQSPPRVDQNPRLPLPPTRRGHRAAAELFVLAGLVVGGLGADPAQGTLIRAVEVPCRDGLEDLLDTSEIVLVEGPFDCGNMDSDEVDCGIFKALIEVPHPQSGPLDDPTLDDDLLPLPILLTVRIPRDVPCALNQAPWVTFDSGGPGQGYAIKFGNLLPGQYVPGEFYGDDLIKAYNDRGAVTIDLTFACSTCDDTPYAGWVDSDPEGGNGWYLDTNGTGYIGAASRARAVYEWAMTNNGGRRLCGHGNSSGSGRLISVLTRFDGDRIFEAMALTGGPVWAYIPWYCGVSDGPLGPPNRDRFDIFGEDRGGDIYDCAQSEGSNAEVCSYDRCGALDYDGRNWLSDSNFFKARRQSFPDFSLAVLLGGDDASPAPDHARLWLEGYRHERWSIGGLEPSSLFLRQGFCDEEDGEYRQGAGGESRPCEHWDGKNFPGVSDGSRGFDSRLVGVGHGTPLFESATEVILEFMSQSCSGISAAPDQGLADSADETANEPKF